LGDGEECAGDFDVRVTEKKRGGSERIYSEAIPDTNTEAARAGGKDRGIAQIGER
jgi:hypothetical protein